MEDSIVFRAIAATFGTIIYALRRPGDPDYVIDPLAQSSWFLLRLPRQSKTRIWDGYLAVA